MLTNKQTTGDDTEAILPNLAEISAENQLIGNDMEAIPQDQLTKEVEVIPPSRPSEDRTGEILVPTKETNKERRDLVFENPGFQNREVSGKRKRVPITYEESEDDL